MGRWAVPERDEAAPVVVPGEVDDDRTQVCRGARLVVDAVSAAGQPDEGLLHEVLGRRAVVDEEARERDQTPALGAKERDDQSIHIDRPTPVGCLVECLAGHRGIRLHRHDRRASRGVG